MAVNFLVSVSKVSGCQEACNNDQRCCHYSYHRSEASHPDHQACYLFSSGVCDTEHLMYTERPQWRTGTRTTLSPRCDLISFISGESDLILSYIRNK